LMKDLATTIIQSELYWEDIDRNLEMFSSKIAAINQPTDLVILPEMFSTGFSMRPEKVAEPAGGKAMQWMKRMAKEKNCVIIGSIATEEGGKYYNRLIWQRPDGSYQQYDKRHLFRYAKEQEHYSAGDKKLIVELDGWKICPLVCYDLRFPVWIRNKWINGIPEYDALIFVANWPERRSHPWKTLLLARAMENQSYVIGVNRVGNDGNDVYHSGDSAVINAKGEVISKTKPKEESVETVTLSRKELEEWRRQFPAWMDADQFSVDNRQ